MKNDYKVIIIGAGVVGLAVARSLAENRLNSVLVIEKERNIGLGTSSRNSEVIHSGLYYPTNSLKAKYCLRGRELMYDFCSKHSIWHNQCGKIIIGQQNQESDINYLYNNAKNNLVPNLRILNKKEIESIEPYISAEIGLLVGCTGIVSSHNYMDIFYNISNNKNHDYLFKSSVIDIDYLGNGYKITIQNAQNDIETVNSEWVINASGLQSDRIAQLLDIKYPNLTYSKGCYFKLDSQWRGKFKHLIYPTPEPSIDSLGIHLSFNRDGQVKLGPNAIWRENRIEDYSVDDDLLDTFYYEASKYILGLKKIHLSPDYAGIRPKIKNPGKKFSDFYISNEEKNGLPGLINLIGIDSPGLTSAIAIGEDIADWIL